MYCQIRDSSRKLKEATRKCEDAEAKFKEQNKLFSKLARENEEHKADNKKLIAEKQQVQQKFLFI